MALEVHYHHRHGHGGGPQVDPRPDAYRPQLRRASVAARTTEVHRGPDVGGAHPGNVRAAAYVYRGLPRGQSALLSPRRRGEDRRRAAVQQLGAVR